jgi:hypothetical protein
MPAIAVLMRSTGACVYAGHAVHALLWGIGELGFERPGLGIMTPTAAQRAALQEYGGSNARAIVKREALDVEDDSIHNFKCIWFFRPKRGKTKYM